MFNSRRDTLRKIIQAPGSIYFLIIAVGAAAYGLQISKLGFYWDDWPWIWRSHIEGPQGMLQIDKIHRPLTGIVLYLGSLFAGENPALWQLYSFTLRLLGAGALAWMLRKLWKNTPQYTTWVALLFLIYPGFSQQFVSINNSRHLFPLITFFLSQGFMLKSLQAEKKQHLNTAIALTMSLLTMLTTEYYYGLELIRPVLIWLYIRRNEERVIPGIRSTLKRWLPYALLVILIFGWRYNVSTRTNYSITVFEQVSENTTSGTLELLSKAANDLYIASIDAWGKIVNMTSLRESTKRIQLYYWIIVAGITSGTLLYLAFLPFKKENAQRKEALLLGLTALLISPIPFWVTGLDPKLGFPDDRLLLPSALGASLLMAVLIDLLLKRPMLKAIALAAIIGLATGSHYQNALVYRTAWTSTTAFFQQLSTRAPSLQANTTILSNQLPGRSTDNSLIAPLNWTYAPGFDGGTLPLQILYVDLRFGRNETRIDKDLFESKAYMQYFFEGSLDNVITVFYEPPACLQLIDPENLLRKIPEPIDAAVPYSNPALIFEGEVLRASLPTFFENPEESPNWCYYFEKADLARQNKNWAEIVQWGDIAFGAGKTPNHPSERIPFIEGYAYTGQWQKAEEITLSVPKSSTAFCQIWAKIKGETSPSKERETAIENVRSHLSCGFE